MEHAEAHERLADLALEPEILRDLDRDVSGWMPAGPSPADPTFSDLARHVAGCERCLADVRGWLRTWSALGDARRSRSAGGANRLDDVAVMPPPDRLRVRTLAAIRATPQHARNDAAPLAIPRRLFASRTIRGLLAVAAVLAIVLTGAIAIQGRIDLGRAQSEQAGLASTTAALDRILATPSHQLLSLHAADGSNAGTLAWNDKEFVVLTTSLNAPAPGQDYRCWIEVKGTRSVLGSLAFTDRVASWSGSMTGWQWDFAPGAQFGVSLYGDGQATPPVLVATLPG